ncbi:hypothetical protein MJO28_008849 [Puccinia striiformis f. sp. tritici]|uniref:Thioredoxin domain-containing protein n=4 Tax=Puccinia striiformis TaxID=27350 RepID=A0A0L0UV37_9BASI|nr:hypothetical protein Pst134EA_015107 [Puccinia striiformis f. sp. tritici]KNE90614.1 hypothetical protein PSTG_15932 [Puccinia striiformis f. sp. tritici PST-78]POW16786.1 hypothetical protein PSTT_01070 [Puccinia striiformis]KAH9452287.1 hypothetical protein Pst134EB_016243 [Puccinia striiformis f. sp. tritici]KAH9463019.1 hypothetical protein Pst134EA_015107 [Puccinia striiformis f. sp. tritici]KAI7950028.1 hypothetical protein MJO28_008849 [Puccinia striiformis f. sp. tritici]
MLLLPDNLTTPSSTHSTRTTSFTIEEIDKLVQFITTHQQSDDITLIFWSSRDSQSGKMWCPDCEEMEINLQNVIKYRELDAIDSPQKAVTDSVKKNKKPQLPFLVYIYVGDRDQWRSAENPFRLSPWNLTKIPTVLKLAPTISSSDNSTKDQISFQEEKLIEKEAIDFKKLLDFLS